MSVIRDVRLSIFEAIRLKAVEKGVLNDITTYIANGTVSQFDQDNQNLGIFIDVTNYTQRYHVENESANFILIDPFDAKPTTHNYYGHEYEPIVDSQGNITGYNKVFSTGNRDITYRITIHASSREAYDLSMLIVGQALPYHYYLPIISGDTEQYTDQHLHIKFKDQLYKEEQIYDRTHFSVAMLYQVSDVPFDGGIFDQVAYSQLNAIRFSLAPNGTQQPITN